MIRRTWRFLAPIGLCSALTIGSAAGAGPAHAMGSLRFHGNGVNDIDRVKIRVDDPATNLAGPPADIGDTDWTLELWLRGTRAENPAPAPACGQELAWITGNIVFDRDRYNQNRKFGLSLGAGVPVFGLSTTAGGSSICGAESVLDGEWHHVAVQRRAGDGHLWMFVDGAVVADEPGPAGLLSYPDDAVPGNFCGGPCTGSDPFIVIGAEKHDADPVTYPPFSGWVDEVRLSTTLRYAGAFARPNAPFAPDPATAALWHFDEAAGDTILDSAPGGASGGVRRFGTGGARPAGPEWSAESPFAVSASPPTPRAPGMRLTASPNPARHVLQLRLEWDAPAPGTTFTAAIHDLAGRVLHRFTGTAGERGAEWTWDRRDLAGRHVAPGVVFVRASGGGRQARTLAVLAR